MKSLRMGAIFFMLFAINSEASDCSDLSGRYELLGHIIEIQQVDCTSMNVTDVTTGETMNSLFFDGVQRKTHETEPGQDPNDGSFGEGMEMYEAHSIFGNVVTSMGFVRNKTTGEEEASNHIYTLQANGDITYEMSQGDLENRFTLKRAE